MAKYYAVRKGYETGIYRDWDTVKLLVNGYPGAVYKSFLTDYEAEEFMGQGKELMELNKGTISARIFYHKDSNPGNTYCVIDYYENKKKVYEENVTINYNNNVKYEHDIELLAVIRAMHRAVELGYKTMNIIYDYPGVIEYLTGYWTAREDSAQIYTRRFHILSEQIKVGFTRNIDDIPN